MARVRVGAPGQDLAQSLDDVIGMQLRRPLGAGQVLRVSDLVRPPLVRRGSSVHIELVTPGLSVSGIAIALESGAEGDTVRVENPASHAFLHALVLGPDRVRVMPEASGVSQTALVRSQR
jgi:flagella basal body P-ring formation protein FlgA